jgi:folylpolyglutamate synthase/dihydropteroate synthase
MLADKDGSSAAEILVPGATAVMIVPVHTPRAGDPTLLRGLCQVEAGAARVGQVNSLQEALTALATEDVIVITGSLYLVGEAMDLLSGAVISERELNDWSPRR